ncbi:hypothetical protein I215_11569 [Galbibacter marinus]|uniref:Cytochrome C oxidase Cbb3 n=1 Tax=Galbibacter marinus TaxID=555500 RepID=K2PPW2_9FLAO|nr:FixH family protein [Galbibacter marinus]EKF54595.1 hypothetical protein I215_11569 [Galbibacter marinus]
MKFNWGTGIVMAFAMFISFIGYLVIKMNTNEIYQHDLVTEDYYKKELDLQQKIDNAAAAATMDYSIKVKQRVEGLLIGFPENLRDDQIKGSVYMYNPSNKKLDFTTAIKLEGSKMLIPSKHLLEGRWDIEINWEVNQIPYYFKTKLMLQ